MIYSGKYCNFMTEITSEEFKENIRNVVNCLINLAPSRNRYTQMLFLLPKNLGEMTETYPQLFSGKTLENLIKIGIRVGETVDVEREYDARGTSKQFSPVVKEIISKILQLFNNKDVRDVLKEFTGEEIPNLLEEWFEQKLQIVTTEENLGNDVKRVLKTMSEKGKYEGWEITIDELVEETGLRKDRIYMIRDFLEEFTIAEKPSYTDGIRLTDQAKTFKESISKVLE